MSAPADRATKASVDTAELLLPGAWRHRFVAANGARFHIAEAGEGPLVLLLHGFPQFWWAWRRQLGPLAAAGFHAVAMDLRGYGASDKPPRGYDTATLAADVAGVIRALGEPNAVVVGHDWGGWLAWSMPGLAPAVVRAVGIASMAHPLEMRAALLDSRQRRAAARVLAFQTPMRPERWLVQGDGVRTLLRDWGGPGYPDAETAEIYRRAIRVPFVAHTSLEYYRWAVRSLPRDGRRFAAAVGHPITVPVLHLHGERDPFVLTETAWLSRSRVGGPFRWHLVPGVGHFLPEEAPDTVTAALLSWLADLG